MSSLGKNLKHDSAETHVSGTSKFIADIPRFNNELIVDYVMSEEAHAEILSIDIADALKIKGIKGVYTYKDIPGHNKFGPILQDEVLLAQDKVEYIGQPIVIIAAEDKESLKQAKKLVKINYKKLQPILSIEEAIEKNSYISVPHGVSRGNTEEIFSDSPNILEGQYYCAGQEHFYLEPQSALAIPDENGCLKILSSTQNPTEVQNVVAEIAGIPFNHVIVETKRMGGAFGGKESQGTHFAAMAALVAFKINRPARIILDREQDMLTTGKRHPFLAEHKVSFDNNGLITALNVNLYSNGGYANDVSTSIMDRAILHTDNAYFIPVIKVEGRVCKTNYAPNTAFRGFGAPQGIFVIESIIEDIANYLNKDAYNIRKLNLYGHENNNITPYGQIVENNTLPELMEKVAKNSEYKQRLDYITNYNNKNADKVRGISCIPMKFGISFTAKFLNQGNALLNIYTDGSIQVSTGGTEMGQGLNTKIRQIVANEFYIPVEKVRVMATSTEKNNNTSPTAASSGTDLNGNAALNACKKIKSRLINFAATLLNSENPDENSIIWNENGIYDKRQEKNVLSYEELIKKAYFNRISLGERGFYATPKIDFSWEKGKGIPFLYYTNGCSVSEVEINKLTGETKVLRTDILMDIGKSINPGIDKGQIIGGFVQGLGWSTIEELKYSESGKLLTDSPANYKIPSINDLPEVLNVDWINNDSNTINVAQSKAIGEPPFVLGLSVWTAIKNAMAFIDKDTAKKLTIPATAEQVLALLNSQERLVNAEK